MLLNELNKKSDPTDSADSKFTFNVFNGHPLKKFAPTVLTFLNASPITTSVRFGKYDKKLFLILFSFS